MIYSSVVICCFSYLFYCVKCGVICEKDVEVAAPDEGHLYRPCQLDDLQCLRKEFRHRGWCHGSRGLRQPADEPLHIKKLNVEQPGYRVTVTQTDMTIRGLNHGRVVQFFINKDTNSAVLAISFSSVTLLSKTEFALHRIGRQDIILLSPRCPEFYSSIVTTTQIKGLKRRSTQKTHSDAAVPIYSFGNTKNMKNKEAITFLDFLSKNEALGVSELFVGRGQLFADFYIQNVICNGPDDDEEDSDEEKEDDDDDDD